MKLAHAALLVVMLWLVSFIAIAPGIRLLYWYHPLVFTQAEMKCFVDNLYHESRGESYEGVYAVGRVVLNRYASGKYPKDLCKIVYQPKQFSWTSSYQPSIRETTVYEYLQEIADEVIQDHEEGVKDPTNGSLHYLSLSRWSAKKRPSWAWTFPIRRIIGQHIFF